MYIETQAPTSTVSTEFLFTDSDFSKVRAMIHRRAGIALGEQKRQMVYSRLSRRLRELRLPEFSSYLELLESRQDGDEWQSFINSLTTNLTSAISAMGLVQGAVGTGENTLSYAVQLAQSQISSFSAAQSAIRDADVATEAANLTKAQILQQSSVAALAQANAAPQALLKLLS